MKKLLFVLITALVIVPLGRAQRNMGSVDLEGDKSVTAVHIAGTPELVALATQAFKAHGAYSVVGGNHGYTLTFTEVTPTQVRVDIAKGANNAPIASEVVTGRTTRNALFKAADVAVTKTSGLRGFFAGRIAFVSTLSGHSEIYTADLFGGEALRITKDNADMLSPRWAPDGSKIIYTSYYKSGFPDIFTIDTSTYQRNTFVSFKGTNSGARYSPDGRFVAMVLSGEGNPEVYFSNAAGKNVHRLTTNQSVEASPCFSPDGSQLVFTSDQLGKPQLFTMPISGGSMQRLNTNISNYCAEPDWSRANPNKIVFTAGVGSGYQVAVYDLSTHSSKVVTTGKSSGDAQEPVWVADGRHVIYTASRSAPAAWVSAPKRATWLPESSRSQFARRPRGRYCPRLANVRTI